ncbi:MAG: esterase [Gammaproteobacteria bacterium]|nr:esterase [Gammaproteobacteria bacterium]
MPVQPYVLYLHGFLSSPRSLKAQQALAYCIEIGLGENITIPQMSHGPAETLAQLHALIDENGSDQLVIIGSSLGGYYATYLSEFYQAPAVLINPAVRPYELWESHLGENRNYHSDEIHVVTREHIEELRLIDVTTLSKAKNFRVFVQKGDETLDYRQALEKFGADQCVVHENGSHSYDDFEHELPVMFDFLLSRIGQDKR